MENNKKIRETRKYFNTRTREALPTKVRQLSESDVDRYLCKEVRARGGLALKYFNAGQAGYPDRIIILPGHPAFWVEVKRPGGAPRPLQQRRHAELKALGQTVHVVDSFEGVEALFDADF